VRLPGPVPGTTLSVLWGDPRPAVIVSRSGKRSRPGWVADLHGCAPGRPDVILGTAFAPDRAHLRLVRVYALLRVTVILLAYRLRPLPAEDPEEP